MASRFRFHFRGDLAKRQRGFIFLSQTYQSSPLNSPPPADVSYYPALPLYHRSLCNAHCRRKSLSHPLFPPLFATSLQSLVYPKKRCTSGFTLFPPSPSPTRAPKNRPGPRSGRIYFLFEMHSVKRSRPLIYIFLPLLFFFFCRLLRVKCPWLPLGPGPLYKTEAGDLRVLVAVPPLSVRALILVFTRGSRHSLPSPFPFFTCLSGITPQMDIGLLSVPLSFLLCLPLQAELHSNHEQSYASPFYLPLWLLR